MSKMRFLLDEHVPTALQRAVWRLDPQVEILCVGQPNAPVKGTADPDLLVWAEERAHALVTADKYTMPLHASNHVMGGRKTWGVFILRKGFTWGDLAEDIHLRWSASEAEEWHYFLDYIPDRRG